MSLVKSGQIANCCAPNALMTLKEYLEDYAAPDNMINYALSDFDRLSTVIGGLLSYVDKNDISNDQI
ncbi:hypothetical protein OSL50_26635, partial [Escherichia coli]|nr:hypothetical protein [Escherichia coli]